MSPKRGDLALSGKKGEAVSRQGSFLGKGNNGLERFDKLGIDSLV